MNAWTEPPLGLGADADSGENVSSAPAIERPFAVTFFQGYAADTKHEERFTLASLAQRIRATTAARKDRLPWLKLATFGEQRTDRNSLRNDANLLAISGVEADYDDEQMPFDQAVGVLSKAGALALVYTSPSHTEAKPRWRVLCPLSAEAAPEGRNHLMGRLNGRPIENNSSPGQAVYEPFSGSGTTLVAAEASGRACHAIELSPAYVDVAVLRWQAFTGQRATLEGDGRGMAEVGAERGITPRPAEDG